MKKLKIIALKRKNIFLITPVILILLAFSLFLAVYFINPDIDIFNDPQTKIIVIDAGHGGIDGGTYSGSLMEKDINLAIAKELKAQLEQRGFSVVMTREEDKSLDSLSSAGGNRHQRDLNARVDIINNSDAQLFISIHVNNNLKNPNANGSIIFYSERFFQNKALAYCIQRALNKMVFNGKARTIHDPQKGEFFILKHSKVPGVLVETAFISNIEERELLQNKDYREEIAKSIASGIERYFNEPSNVFEQN